MNLTIQTKRKNNIPTNRNNHNKNNKTIKKKWKNFYGTPQLPYTTLFYRMKKNFPLYWKESKERDEGKIPPISMNDFFFINHDVFYKDNEEVSIDRAIDRNPNTSLDTLISYSFYTKQKYAFYNDATDNMKSTKEMLSIIKSQMGKDIRRSDFTVNDQLYSKSMFDDPNKTNDEVTDEFYKIIIQYVNQYESKINLNVVNKIGLLSCQNTFNFVTDLIKLKIMSMLKPENVVLLKAKKNMNIILTQEKQIVELEFQSKLLISQDLNLDPEYPCGNLEFKLWMDLKTNEYKFNKFKLNYKLKECGPPKEEEEIENPRNSSFHFQLKPEYVIPLTAVTAGVIAAPFLLGVLGGKKRNKTKKARKTKKERKTKKARKTKKERKRMTKTNNLL